MYNHPARERMAQELSSANAGPAQDTADRSQQMENIRGGAVAKWTIQAVLPKRITRNVPMTIGLLQSLPSKRARQIRHRNRLLAMRRLPQVRIDNNRIPHPHHQTASLYRRLFADPLSLASTIHLYPPNPDHLESIMPRAANIVRSQRTTGLLWKSG